MKLSRKLLTALSVGLVLPIASMPIVACNKNKNTDYSAKYSARVKTVINHLVEMNKKPRCTWKDYEHSYTLDNIRNYIIGEANRAGIQSENIHIDDYGNLWFDVEATSGCDEYEPLIMQAHMDMVVDGMSEEDKKVKPIDTVVDWKNGLVHSRDYKTSLGADDGFGVALMLTIIQDKSIPHGPLRLIFTANEDSGMIGASWMSKDDHNEKWLFRNMKQDYTGKNIRFLLNIDAEELGYAYQSCTGSITYDYSCEYDVSSGEEPLANKYFIQVKDLIGGHSGDNIPKDYASAEKLAFEILYAIQNADTQIVKNYHPKDGQDVSFARNQIVSHSKLLFRSSADLEKIKSVVQEKIDEFKTRYPHEDWSKELITFGNASDDEADFSKFISKENSTNIINKLGQNVGPDKSKTASCIWYGTYTDQTLNRMSANLSPVNIHLKDGDSSKFTVNINSQIRTVTNNGLDHMKNFYASFKFKDALPIPQSEYPAWTTDPYNKMVDRACESYTKHGVTPKKFDCTGGVEPTFWVSCNPQLQPTAIGADIKGAHSSKETLYIDTIQPVIDVAIDLIKSMEQGINKN